MNPALKRTVLILNTLGFIFYLVWLTQFNTSETMRTQDGIIFYIPCVPFLFLYMLMLPPKPKGKPWWQSDEDYEKEQRAGQKDSANPAPPPPNPAAKP